VSYLAHSHQTCLTQHDVTHVQLLTRLEE
jgi:hypothetical protein